MNNSENKKDKLEQFISKNREELRSQFTPPANLWSRLEAELEKEEEPKAKVIPLKSKKEAKVITIRHSTLRIAAVALLLLGSVWGIWSIQKRNTQAELGGNQVALDLKQINPELAEAESYYTSLINQKKHEIENYSFEDPELDKEFKNDLKELNQMYEQLKTELKGQPKQSQVMDAMIQNLQMRINVLNRQLEILKKIKNKEKDNTENEEETNI
jgi:transcription initiation factor TFIIIB Brf1 subunit/transcription initiation factor TFIIB